LMSKREKVMMKAHKSEEKNDSSQEMLFDNLVWLNSEEAAKYLRKSVGALRVLVHRKHLIPRKWKRRLYFKRSELNRLLENSLRKENLSI